MDFFGVAELSNMAMIINIACQISGESAHSRHALSLLFIAYYSILKTELAKPRLHAI